MIEHLHCNRIDIYALQMRAFVLYIAILCYDDDCVHVIMYHDCLYRCVECVCVNGMCIISYDCSYSLLLIIMIYLVTFFYPVGIITHSQCNNTSPPFLVPLFSFFKNLHRFSQDFLTIYTHDIRFWFVILYLTFLIKVWLTIDSDSL